MPSVVDVAPIAAVLRNASLGPPLAHGAVTVVPLLGGAGLEPDWLTLAESGEAVAIAEVGNAGSVPELTVTSTADRPVLLLDGEELVGAKQNRVLNTTVLVGPRARLTIPVSCVEAGRWSARGGRLAHGGATLYASVRASKAAQVSESLRRGTGHRSDQGQVWDELAEHADRHRVASPTGAMHDVYEQHAGDLEAARRALGAQPGQVGAVVYLGRGPRRSAAWLGLDVLASPRLFARAWPHLCTGYAAEGVGEKPGGAPAPGPAAVLERVLRARVEEAPAVGLGRELRLRGPSLHGAALLVDDTLAHLMAFPATARRQKGPRREG
jgi:hypothetical protein